MSHFSLVYSSIRKINEKKKKRIFNNEKKRKEKKYKY